jgi:hypothetical protein
MQQGRRLRVDTGPTRLARAGDVQRIDVMCAQPSNDGRGICGVEIDDQARLPVPMRHARGVRRATGKRPAIEYEGGISVAHVLFGARRILGRVGLAQGIARGEPTVLGAPSARTPATAGQMQRQRASSAARSTPVWPPDITVG